MIFQFLIERDSSQFDTMAKVINKVGRVHDKANTHLPTYLLIYAFWTFLFHIGKHARSFNPLQGSRVRATSSLPLQSRFQVLKSIWVPKIYLVMTNNRWQQPMTLVVI